MSNLAKDLLIPGAVGVIPTDTIYGLAARAEDHSAVERLYKLKQRTSKPGTVIAADLSQLQKLGLKYRYLKAVEEYWPGPVSVIIPLSGHDLFYLSQNKPTLAVRLPADKAVRDLLKQTGPLLTTSANKPNEKPAETIQDAQAYFGDQVDFYVDGGNLGKREPSTIIKIIDDAVEIIRAGAAKIP